MDERKYKKKWSKANIFAISIFSLDGINLSFTKNDNNEKNLDIKGLTKEVIKFIISKFTSREIFIN